MNKPAKDYMKRQFDEPYSKHVLTQLEGEDTTNLETLELQPINLGLPEFGAKWLVDMSSYISNNPQLIVNGFIRSGIAGALNGQETDETEGNQELDSEDDFNESEADF